MKKIFLLLFIASGLLAQESRFTKTLWRADGRLLKNATVTISPQEGTYATDALALTESSNKKGMYERANVTAGLYKIYVNSNGDAIDTTSDLYQSNVMHGAFVADATTIEVNTDAGTLGVKDSSISLSKMTTATVNFIGAGGEVTNMPDDLSTENSTDTTLQIKEDFYNAKFTEYYADLATAITAASTNNKDVYISSNEAIISNDTVPINVRLKFAKGNKITVSDTLVVTGELDAGLWQIFDLTGVGYVDLSNAKIDKIYPQWFGAITNDGVDDTQAMQEAINSFAGGSSSKIIFLSAGKYKIDSTLTLQSDTKLVGEGEPTYLDCTGLTALDNAFELAGATVSDVIIKDFRIDGQSDDYAVSGTTGLGFYIHPTDADRITISGLRVSKFRNGISVSVADTVDNLKITGNWVNSCSYAAIRVVGSTGAIITNNQIDSDRTGVGDAVDGGLSIWVTFSNYTIVSNNYCANTFGRGLESINVHSKYAVISINELYNNYTGIVVEPLVTSDFMAFESGRTFTDIIGNVITDSYTGIALRNDPANNTMGVHNNLISGNIIRNTNSASAGIQLANELLQDSLRWNTGNTISNNSLYNSVIKVWGAKNTHITNNTIVCSDSNSTGIDLASSDSTFIDGGLITSSKHGVKVRNDCLFTSITNLKVVNWDTSTTNPRGIQIVDDSKDFIFKNNTFILAASVTPSANDERGIVLGSATGFKDISGNKYIGWTSSGRNRELDGYKDSLVFDTQLGQAQIFTGDKTPSSITTAHQGSLYLRTDGNGDSTLYIKESGGNFNSSGWENIPRFFRGSVQWNAPQLVADSSTNSGNIFLSGAEVGDAIIIQPTTGGVAADFKHLLYAHVSEADSIVINITNATGSTSDLANATYGIVRVRK